MDEPKDLDFALWLLLSRTHQLIRKIRHKEFKEYKIPGRSAAILELTSRLGEDATQAAFVNETYSERQSISEQLSRMEKQGLIKKVRDLGRKNAVRIEMTDKGYELLKDASIRKSLRDSFTSLSEEEKSELWRILSKIRGKALKDMELKNATRYPPDDMEEFLSDG
jgi:DNA-binding MarR family transcriptional regulator